jgi:hypothetical protein
MTSCCSTGCVPVILELPTPQDAKGDSSLCGYILCSVVVSNDDHRQASVQALQDGSLSDQPPLLLPCCLRNLFLFVQTGGPGGPSTSSGGPEPAAAAAAATA